jgi:putative PIN family toxin of toxin-antitoxin system
VIIVLDTNVLIGAIPRRADLRWLWDAYLRGDYRLAVTTEILREYEELLSDFYSSEISENVVNMIVKARNTDLITAYYKYVFITNDVDDNKFSDCYLASQANHIVTYDAHFNALKKIEFPPFSVLSPEEFRKIL